MGLVIFGAMALYLVLAIFVVTGAISHARKHGKSVKRWGWGAALVMYLIPFWDWIPTVAVHQYYCATEAGFWVYKTPEQWKKENPGVMETLVADRSGSSRREARDGGRDEIVTYRYNQRFKVVVFERDISPFLPIIRGEEVLIDIGKDAVLARYVDFGTGNSVKSTVGLPGPLKFWLHSPYCAWNSEVAISSRKWINQFRGAEK